MPGRAVAAGERGSAMVASFFVGTALGQPVPLPAPARDAGRGAVVHVVSGEQTLSEAVCAMLGRDGRAARLYEHCSGFLRQYREAPGECLLIDGDLPGADRLDLLRRLRATGQTIPAIVITGRGDVRMAVEAVQAGASDFIERPLGGAELLATVQRALDQAVHHGPLARPGSAAAKLDTLTIRQREIMARVLDGQPSKTIAADLSISRRTVENHRAAIMQRTGSSSLPALARLAVAAAEPMARVTGAAA